jgi:hypothetical protein
MAFFPITSTAGKAISGVGMLTSFVSVELKILCSLVPTLDKA